MASAFIVQIAHRADGVVVEWAPGLRAEVELIENLCARVKAKGVGVGRSEAHVVQDVHDAFVELLRDLKSSI